MPVVYPPLGVAEVFAGGVGDAVGVGAGLGADGAEGGVGVGLDGGGVGGGEGGDGAEGVGVEDAAGAGGAVQVHDAFWRKGARPLLGASLRPARAPHRRPQAARRSRKVSI